MTIKNITHAGWGVSRRLEVPLCTHEDLSLNPQDPHRGRAWPKVPIILILETDLRGLLASQSDLRSEAFVSDTVRPHVKEEGGKKEDTSPAPAPPQNTQLKEIENIQSHGEISIYILTDTQAIQTSLSKHLQECPHTSFLK